MQSLEFSNLPLIEAAVRLTLKEGVPLTYNRIFQFKERVGGRFTMFEDSNRIEAPPGQDTHIQFTGGPMVAVFCGNKNGLKLRLQPNLISVHWQLSIEPNAPEYPRYSAMREVLESTISEFADVFKPKEELKFLVANIFYHNLIESENDLDVLDNYFTPSVRPPIMTSERHTQKLEASWSEKGAIDLRFCIQQAKVSRKDRDADINGFKLTTAAGAWLEESSNALDSLDMLHLRLQVLFLEMISDRAKEEWGLTQ